MNFVVMLQTQKFEDTKNRQYTIYQDKGLIG